MHFIASHRHNRTVRLPGNLQHLMRTDKIIKLPQQATATTPTTSTTPATIAKVIVRKPYLICKAERWGGWGATNVVAVVLVAKNQLKVANCTRTFWGVVFMWRNVAVCVCMCVAEEMTNVVMTQNASIILPRASKNNKHGKFLYSAWRLRKHTRSFTYMREYVSVFI